ncbi:hypothetical protein ETH_00038605, partial [Eimeria tenella]
KVRSKVQRQGGPQGAVQRSKDLLLQLAEGDPELLQHSSFQQQQPLQLPLQCCAVGGLVLQRQHQTKCCAAAQTLGAPGGPFADPRAVQDGHCQVYRHPSHVSSSSSAEAPLHVSSI